MKTPLTVIACVIAIASLFHGTDSAPLKRDPVTDPNEKAKVSGNCFDEKALKFSLFACMYQFCDIAILISQTPGQILCPY